MSRCDATVHNTIYDLFLCSDCERTREKEESNLKLAAAGNTHDSNGSSVTASVDGKGDKTGKTRKRGEKPAVANTAVSNASDQQILKSTLKQKVSTVKEIAKPSRKQPTLSQPTSGTMTAEMTQIHAASQFYCNSANSTEDTDNHRMSDDDNDDAGCPHCLLPVNDDGRCVKCDLCRQYYHHKCIGLTAKIFDKFIMYRDITGWVCDDCKTAARQSYRRLAAAVAHLAEQVASLKCELSDMSKSHAATVADQEHSNVATILRPAASELNNDTKTSDSESKTMLIVHRTINDTARRKRNIVISGLPEPDDGNDRSQFLTLCEEQLPMKPAVTEKDCIRLGKKLSDRPRRLLVKLNSEETATGLLRAAPMLRKSSDLYVAQNVFINADLSPAAAQLAYEARKVRREAATRRRAVVDNTMPTALLPVQQSTNDQHQSAVNDISTPTGQNASSNSVLNVHATDFKANALCSSSYNPMI